MESGKCKNSLTLQKTDQVISINRPQAPKAPFPYQAEEIEYENADKSIRFGGTFTFPSIGVTFPTVISITGSDKQDRDENVAGHKPFAIIADYLTRKGFAVLRIDDRGIGKSTGMAKSAASLDFANDVKSGIEYLKTRTEVNKNKLGILGHSEGGLIASIIASKRKDIDFIILLASPGVPGSTLIEDQSASLLKSIVTSSESIDYYLPFMKKFVEIAIAENDSAIFRKKIWNSYIEWNKKTPYINKKELGLSDAQSAEKSINQLI